MRHFSFPMAAALAGAVLVAMGLIAVVPLAEDPRPAAPANPGAGVVDRNSESGYLEPGAVLASAAIDLATTPIHFEPNHGQADKSAKFLSRGLGNTLLLTSSGLRLIVPPAANDEDEAAQAGVEFGVRLLGANPNPQITGLDPLPGRSNYFIGVRENWHSDVPHFGRVKYERIYPGIDLVLYGNQGYLEYDFLVAPGADPNLIRLGFEGAEELHLDEDGNLVATYAHGEIVQRAPMIYQEVDNRRLPVAGGYKIETTDMLGGRAEALDETRRSRNIRLGGKICCEARFELASYRRDQNLVIDPVLDFSTYIGGSTADIARDIAVDENGFVYLVGYTTSTDFPTVNSIQDTFASTKSHLDDVFVTKLHPSGLEATYSTYLGGHSGESGYGICVDAAGNAYIAGTTPSSDFPTVNAYQPQLMGSIDVVMAKLDSTGNLVFSTYFGRSGDDRAYAIDVDSSGNIYLGGYTTSTDFPTVNAVQGTHNAGTNDAFLLKFNATATSLDYSTFLGGADNHEYVTGIAADRDGVAYVTGKTQSTDFPTWNALKGTLGGSGDVFVTKLDTIGSAIHYSTFLGGTNGDTGGGIAIDANGNAYVSGFTLSSDFPTVQPFDGSLDGYSDIFVAKLNSQGSALVFSTYLGGSRSESGADLAVDARGNIYVAGGTESFDFPTVRPIQPMKGDHSDGFLTLLAPAGNTSFFSTYLGGESSDYFDGIAVGQGPSIYVAGYASSTDFPTKNAFQGTYGGGYDYDAVAVKLVAALDFFIASALQPPQAPQLSGLSTAGAGGDLVRTPCPE